MKYLPLSKTTPIIPVYRLTKEFIVITDGTNTWDENELFILVSAEKKRHEKGKYPDRFISCTDGSMIAKKVIESFEKRLRHIVMERVL